MHAPTKDHMFDRYRKIIDSGEDEWLDAPVPCPVSEYSSLDRLKLEREKLFRGGPIVAAMTADVSAPGSAFATDVDGVPLLVVRDRENKVRVFVNSCRHRGTKLFEGQGPVARVLVCPYHAWTYTLSGDLQARPNGEACFSGIARESLGLRELPSDEGLGVIVTRLDGQGEVDVRVWAGDLADDLASYELEKYTHVETRTFTWDFNWKMAMDTFLEAYHVFVLHKKSIFEYIPSWPMLIEPRSQHLLTLTPWRRMQDQPDHTDLLKHATVQHVMLPNTIIAHQIDHVETWNFYPDGDNPSRCIAVTSLYAPTPPSTEKEAARWERALDILLNVINNEDFPQCVRMQKGIDSGAVIDDFLFGQNEPGVARFHQNLNAALKHAPASATVGAGA